MSASILRARITAAGAALFACALTALFALPLRASTVALPLRTSTVALAAAPPVAAAALQDVQERIDRAIEHIQAQQLDAALVELDAALESDPDSWLAYYQRGRVRGLRGELGEALTDLLSAADLNPGTPQVHELASVAAWAIGDRDIAWDQVILAHLAGGDVAGRIQRMAQDGVPEDFQARMTAPRVHVDEITLDEIESRAEVPFDRNALARADQNRSGVPVDVLGAELATETMADLRRVRLRFRAALADSALYGVVGEGHAAEYDLRIAVDELSERPPRKMVGYVELVARDSGAVGYRRTIQLEDISAAGLLRGDVELIVDDLETWLRDLRRQLDEPPR